MKHLSCFVALTFMAALGLPTFSWAQADSLKKALPTEEVEDYSGYGDDANVRRFCTQKVQYLAPAKLISLGYEVQGPHELVGVRPQEGQPISLTHGLRLAFNAPVISRSSIIVNLGASYYESKMNFEDPEKTDPFGNALSSRGLRTGGLMLTVFKPLNEKNFIIAAANADLNGNFGWDNVPSLQKLTYSGLLVYGWKKSDKLMWGLGLSRTYRLGEANYVPVLLLNKTFNDKWGIEALLPARGHVRRSFSAKSLAMFGYELEGNSYLINTETNSALGRIQNDGTLRRSELKVRLMYERSLHNFIWFSVQAGLRINSNFQLVSNTTNQNWGYGLGNPLYFGFSLNLVSP